MQLLATSALFLIPLLVSRASALQNASADTPLSIWMASSIMARSQGVMTGSGGSSELLQAGITQKAFRRIIEQYPNSTSTPDIEAYLHKSVNSTVQFLNNATKDTTYPLDRLSNGNNLIQLSDEADNSSAGDAYLSTVHALRKSIDLQPRNGAGGLWYYVYPNWSYLDGMYSLGPFYALYTGEFDAANRTAFADLFYQFELLWNRCRNESSGLLVHGYDFSKTAVWANSLTGASPHVWGRSLGWFMMALVDTIEILHGFSRTTVSNSTDKILRDLKEMFVETSKAIVAAVDASSGAWWQVMDVPGAEGNYIESSGSAMFTYSLLKGKRLGYLGSVNGEAAVAEKVATRAYDYIVQSFVIENSNATLDYNGTVAVCSLNSTASYEYYVKQPLLFNSVLGSGSFILASLEYEHLKRVGK